MSDALSQTVWFSGVINACLAAIDATVPIVLSCTSIPKQFSQMSECTPVLFNNRILVNQVQRLNNQRTIVYGDWGSTRPRAAGSFGMRPLDRIDYPARDRWFFARNKNKNWTFKEAAEAIVNDPAIWDGKLGIWGEDLIAQTATNQNLGVSTPPKNIAARVNIHLHLQAFYHADNLHGINFDEPWED